MIPAWSPDGRLIVTVDIHRTDCSGIVTMKSDGSNETCLNIDGINSSIHVASPCWSPDGNFIIFAYEGPNFTSGDIYVVKPNGSDLTRLVNLQQRLGNIIWSAGQ